MLDLLILQWLARHPSGERDRGVAGGARLGRQEGEAGRVRGGIRWSGGKEVGLVRLSCF